MFACFAHGEQQTNEPESQTPTQISPHCAALCSAFFFFFFFFKSHLEIGVETKTVLLVSVFLQKKGEDALVSPPFLSPQLKRCPQPLGK